MMIPTRTELNYMDDHDLVKRLGGTWDDELQCYVLDEWSDEYDYLIDNGQWKDVEELLSSANMIM